MRPLSPHLKISASILCVAACQLLPASDPGQWPKWRGPDDNGMARTDASLRRVFDTMQQAGVLARDTPFEPARFVDESYLAESRR